MSDKPEKTIQEFYGKMAGVCSGLDDLFTAIPDEVSDGMEKRINGIRKSIIRLRDSVVSRLDRLGKKSAATEKKRDLLARIEKRAKNLKAELGE